MELNFQYWSDNLYTSYLIKKLTSGMEKIEMKDMDSCEKEDKRWEGNKMSKKYICIIEK